VQYDAINPYQCQCATHTKEGRTSDGDDLLDQRILLLLVLGVEILVVVIENLERLGREEDAVRLVRQLDVLGLVLDR
jgi:hypothetical protein